MPSTLPLLGRSNSNSSQGSFSETRDSPYSSYAALTQSPSLSHSQSSLPSYTHSSTPSETPTYSSFPRASTSFPGALTSPPPPTASATATAAAASISTIRRPFHLLRQILESLDGQGAYVTPRLFVPPQVWSQAGVKLVALETKVRMLDLLLSGLDSLSKVAVGWSEGRANVKGWNSELESFEGLMEGIQSTLSKKLGYGTGGKKMGSTSFSAWSSKLSRSLDRVANGRSLDKPDVYSEILAKVLRGANVIDLHLDLLATNSGPYSTLSPSDRARIEQRLKRASDFFGQVICRFVMRDVGMLVDKCESCSFAFVRSRAQVVGAVSLRSVGADRSLILIL
ncbi:hypothetical protein BCR35DRAFT_271856 [Leucosporidium creatinivorum]|uniref:Uncharacterized protein n=1 Tax=Leucosporidium creatinivorum TaxID=106004 RepID=A0A1Y2D8G6_9BASI|nr:hypothetical protein BCR35DRAFT_271856 [Leucosporidium creatinivorum]